MITRDDVRQGRVAKRRIERGVVVPPALQINALTLREQVARARQMGKALTRDEAKALGHDAVEIIAEFGP